MVASVRFLLAGCVIEFPTGEARRLARALREFDPPRVLPEGGLDISPGDAAAAAAVIDDAIETGDPVDLSPGEARMTWALLDQTSFRAQLPAAHRKLHGALADELTHPPDAPP